MSFPVRWALAALGFPLGGLLAVLVAGSADGPRPAGAGGALAGGVIGGFQWWALRPHEVPTAWIALSAAGLGGGSALGVQLTGGAPTASALAVLGMVAGAVLGAAQAIVLPVGRLRAAWPGVVALAWSLAWPVTAAVITDEDRGYVVPGASGAIVATLVTGLFLVLARLPEPAV